MKGLSQMGVKHGSCKILHILDHSVPLHSGYAFRSQNIFRTQRKRGWQPIILTSPKHEEHWNGRWYTEEEIDGCHYYRTGAISRHGWLGKAELRLMRTLARRMRDVVEREQPNLLHVHSPILNALPAFWVGRQCKLPVVYEMRSSWEDAAVGHGTYGHRSWKYQMVKSIETWVCRQADAVAVLCYGLKEDLIKRGIPSQKLTVVPNGVNVDDFQSCDRDQHYLKSWNLVGKRVIGFIGSFNRYEGLDLLVDAFARLAVTRSDIALLLVGGGEMEVDLKAQIQRLRLEDNVIMPGRIPHERIPGIYALVDILAYPRYSMRLTELVTPLKPLEAMAMGKALVASDIGGHRELIQHGQTGFLFPAGQVSALVVALAHLLDDHALRQNLERQATTWVHQERVWDKTTVGYFDIYAGALHRASDFTSCPPL